MGKIGEFVEEVRQHHHKRRLISSVLKEYADDPDVVFHEAIPEGHDAPHGVNAPEEMTHSAVTDTD